MEQFKLPDEITPVTLSAPRDLVIVSIPKAGKSNILGDLTRKQNAVILDIEKGGYEYIASRKLSTYTSQDVDRWGSFQNYVEYRKLLIDNKGKYEYLIIDGLTDLDDLSEIGGTLLYMDSIIGKKFNRNPETLEKYKYGDVNWKSVLTLPEGAGFKWTRDWFMQQVEIFRQIAPYRIYAAHVVDKYIKEKGKDEVVGSEISLTGKLKIIFASRVTALSKLVVDENKRYLSFDVVNDSVITGSRAPQLKGKILISEMSEDGILTTYWENIYNNNLK